MFHFPTFPPLTLCVQVRVTGHDSSWVSPFGHPRITAWLPTPRGLSQAPTSFIGSWCQGIHHVPFIACLNNVKTTQLQRPLPPTPIKGGQHKKSHKTPTSIPSNHQPEHRSAPPGTMRASDARVHYPDLKQQPHQPPATPTQGDHQTKGGTEQPATTHPARAQQPKPPEPHQTNSPDPSGPNSVPRPSPPHRPPGSTPTPLPKGNRTGSTERANRTAQTIHPRFH